MAAWGLGSCAAYATTAVATVGVVAASPLWVPATVGALGFGSGGIVAGSWAAGLMSSYGGAVSSGSLCALLQSVGAAGLSTSTIVGAEAAAAGLAGGFTAFGRRFFKKGTAPSTGDEKPPLLCSTEDEKPLVDRHEEEEKDSNNEEKEEEEKSTDEAKDGKSKDIAQSWSSMLT